MQPPPTVHEEEPHSTPELCIPPRTPAFGANPHSCSSRARPLSHGQGASPGNLLFKSPFDRDPEPPASAAGHRRTRKLLGRGCTRLSSPWRDPRADDSQASPIAAARPRAQPTNPFEVPEMMDISLAEPQQIGAEDNTAGICISAALPGPHLSPPWRLQPPQASAWRHCHRRCWGAAARAGGEWGGHRWRVSAGDCAGPRHGPPDSRGLRLG